MELLMLLGVVQVLVFSEHAVITECNIDNISFLGTNSFSFVALKQFSFRIVFVWQLKSFDHINAFFVLLIGFILGKPNKLWESRV